MNWDIDRNGEYETATYRGLEIRALPDRNAENPWEAWDGEPPLVARDSGFMQTHGARYGDPLNPFADLPDSWFSRNWRAIAKAFDVPESDFDSECRGYMNKGDSLTLWRRDVAESMLSDARPGRDGYGFNDAAQIAARLWAIRGVEAISTTVTGYVQGDWAHLLIVATPAWVKATGAPAKGKECRDQLQASARLYASWAYGDVYGFEIVDSDGDALESVWGYYGSDHAESGLEETARGMADSILSDAADRRAARLGELIRNHVPLHVRAAELAKAGTLQGRF